MIAGLKLWIWRGRSIFQAIVEIKPALCWAEVNAKRRAKWDGETLNIVPARSFAKGVKYIMESDQDPFFWNFSKGNAFRIIDCVKARRKYSYLDLPETNAVTRGESPKDGDQID